MQVLKDEIRDRILSEAELLFFEKGFSGTSTRSIAASAGISVSNLYKYFKDKDAVFSAVINPFFSDFSADIEAVMTMEHNNDDPDIMENVIAVIMKMMVSDSRRFVILMDRSDSTRYAKVKMELIAALAGHMAESISAEKNLDIHLLRILSENLIRGIIELAAEYGGNTEAVERNIDALIRYHMIGIQQFF